MSITSLEELTTLDPGVEVVINNAANGRTTWSKAEDGRFRHAATGAMVRPDVFVGSVAAGAVSLLSEVPPEVGEVWRDTTYWMLIAGFTPAADGGGAIVHCGRFRRRDDTWAGLANIRLTYFTSEAGAHRVTNPDLPWVRTVTPMVTAFYTLNQSYQALVAQPVPVNLVGELHGYAENVDDDTFDHLLARHNIGRTRPHVSEVRLFGTMTYAPPNDIVTALIGDEFDASVTREARVDWERTVTITRDGVGCTCGDISEADLRGYAPANNTSELDWEVECR
jgi:hypothetical protein